MRAIVSQTTASGFRIANIAVLCNLLHFFIHFFDYKNGFNDIIQSNNSGIFMEAKNQDNFLSDNANKKGKGTKTAFLIAVIILILAVAAYVAFILRNKPAEIIEPETKELELSDYKSALLGQTKLALQEIESAEPVSMSKLPAKLVFLTEVASSSLSLEINKVFFKDKSAGYRIIYKIADSKLYDLHKNFKSALQQNNWTLVFGSRTNLFALLEAENKTYGMRLSESQAGADVEIEAVIVLK